MRLRNDIGVGICARLVVPTSVRRGHRALRQNATDGVIDKCIVSCTLAQALSAPCVANLQVFRQLSGGQCRLLARQKHGDKEETSELIRVDICVPAIF